MTTSRTLTSSSTKATALALGAALSMAWLGAMALGFQSTSAPATVTVELPRVVVVGRRIAEPAVAIVAPTAVAS